MEKIIYRKTLIAIRFRKFKKGATPLTDHSESLQLVALKYPKGRYVKPHIHQPKKRITQKSQECLVVLSGRIKIDLYAPDKTFVKSLLLSKGEAAILLNGGHGVRILEDSEMFELKNGPFVEDKVIIE